MTLALLDCPTGLAGDMLLAALLDLGLPQSAIHEPLHRLGLGGSYDLELSERRSRGLRGLHLTVKVLEPQPLRRDWQVLRPQLLNSGLDPDLAGKVLEVFTLLAEAEATVHGLPAERVHFHEVGAIDALVDIVGVCAGLLHLKVDRLICAIPPAGHGTVATAHGLLPLPAPAVLEIARTRAIPLGGSGDFPAGELTTPTGLALMACWADRFGPPPGAVPRRVGVGLGSRELDHRPNLLRLTLADPLPPSEAVTGSAPGVETLLLQQAQIDDATAEDLAFLAQALREAGALEVFSQSIAMKKGRQGTLLSALAPPEQGDALRRVWWCHATTLGVREQLQQRWILERHNETIETRLGPVRLKRALLPEGGSRHKPEHEDLATLARRHNLSLAQVRAEVEQAMRRNP